MFWVEENMWLKKSSKVQILSGNLPGLFLYVYSSFFSLFFTFTVYIVIRLRSNLISDREIHTPAVQRWRNVILNISQYLYFYFSLYLIFKTGFNSFHGCIKSLLASFDFLSISTFLLSISTNCSQFLEIITNAVCTRQRFHNFMEQIRTQKLGVKVIKRTKLAIIFH